jgi:hypothetical protein
MIATIIAKWNRFWLRFHEGKGDEYFALYKYHAKKAERYYRP